MLQKEKPTVPIWEKLNLTIEEAAAYSRIGENRIKELLDHPDCPFILYVGTQRRIKRKQFEEYNDKVSSIP